MAVHADGSAEHSRVVGARIDVWHLGTSSVSEAKPRTILGDRNARSCVVLFEEIPEESNACSAGSGSGHGGSTMTDPDQDHVESAWSLPRHIEDQQHPRDGFRPARGVRFSIGA